MRDAGRGCLLALVLEGAALLAVVLWVISWVFEFPRLRIAAMVAFAAFTLASAGVVLMMVILGNTPGQRRLRREAQAEAGGNPGDANSVAEGPMAE